MITVYHGSNEAIESPLVGIGRQNLDFGIGFYVTNMIAQAETWAGIKGRLFSQPKFEHYDREWLHFIVGNRRGGDEWKQWDIIEGGVANDRVIDTVENYMAGLIDEETALGLLAQHQPNHQICITKQEVVDKYMHFVESVQVKAYAE